MPAIGLTEAFETQIALCRQFGAELCAGLLEAVLDELRGGGELAALLAGWEGDARRDNLPLRLLGAVHRLALAGRAPELARCYPTLGGVPHWPEVWLAFRALVLTRWEELRPLMTQFPQTNEVGRAAILLGGYLELARRWGLPLRLRELGASAGLNLHWDRYRYELGPHRWGAAGEQLTLAPVWEGGAPSLATPVFVESRAGCDLAPVDVRDPEVRLTLESYVWADHPDRMAQLRAAVRIAADAPPVVERANAVNWLRAGALWPAEGLTRVVVHTIVWPYLSAPERQALRGLIEQAGAASTAATPLAWLRFEHGELRLRDWPGGAETLLATAHAHGRWVRWLGRQDASGARVKGPA